MIFGDGTYLATPYDAWGGAAHKNDALLEAVVAHPSRFLVSACSGDPRVVVAALLTHPDNAAWEVWRGGEFSGILMLDRVVARVDARMHFAFFDTDLDSKAPLLADFVTRCFAEFGLHRLTFEVPATMTTLMAFLRNKLGFVSEGSRRSAYHDGVAWRDLAVFARHAQAVPRG